jgi:hypothetical protein
MIKPKKPRCLQSDYIEEKRILKLDENKYFFKAPNIPLRGFVNSIYGYKYNYRDLDFTTSFKRRARKIKESLGTCVIFWDSERKLFWFELKYLEKLCKKGQRGKPLKL